MGNHLMRFLFSDFPKEKHNEYYEKFSKQSKAMEREKNTTKIFSNIDGCVRYLGDVLVEIGTETHVVGFLSEHAGSWYDGCEQLFELANSGNQRSRNEMEA